MVRPHKLFIRYVLLLCIILSLNGCFASVLIGSFGELGATKGDRMRLLPDDVKSFHHALYWGDSSEAEKFIVGEGEIIESLRATTDQEVIKIVNSKIKSVEYSEDARQAEVKVRVKYYKVPYYVINERTDVENWEFGLSTGWKLAAREEVHSKRGSL